MIKKTQTKYKLMYTANIDVLDLTTVLNCMYFILKLHCELLMVPLNKKLYYLSSSDIFSINLHDPEMYRSI